ncbi:protein of unknown function [Burkholderia multivorans]
MTGRWRLNRIVSAPHGCVGWRQGYSIRDGPHHKKDDPDHSPEVAGRSGGATQTVTITPQIARAVMRQWPFPTSSECTR